MKRKLFTLILSVIFLINLTACGSKDKNNTDNSGIVVETVFTAEQVCNMAVKIEYDIEPPTVGFLAPDGTQILGDDCYPSCGNGWAKYYLQDVQEGEYKISYLKGKNESVSVTSSSYVYALSIDSFKIGKASSTSIPITFAVTSDTEGTAQYKVLAFIEDGNKTVYEKVLEQGMVNLNVETSKTINIRNLTEGGYKIRLDVTLQYADALAQTSQTAEPYILTVKATVKDENSKDKEPETTADK